MRILHVLGCSALVSVLVQVIDLAYSAAFLALYYFHICAEKNTPTNMTTLRLSHTATTIIQNTSRTCCYAL